MENIVRVGVGICVIRENKFLIGKRLNSHGSETFSFPGGHMEFGESLEETAKREVKEETGLDVSDIKFLGVTNDIFEKENKHYITIFVSGKSEDGEPQLLEPHKCEGWNWITLNELPENIFVSLSNFLKSEFREKLEEELRK